MAIDYSKWDKLELSDDSDVEVHPNVDKTSFIRWKQRDIHEKRVQREANIKNLRVQKEMYNRLNERVDSMLLNLKDDELANDSARHVWVDSKFDRNEKCHIEESHDQPTYNDMVDDLFEQIKGDLQKEKVGITGKAIRIKVMEHRDKIEKVLKQIDPKLEELYKEKSQHISSDDIRDGWNSSFLNKSKAETQAETTVETINSPHATASTIAKTPKAAVSGSTASPSKPLETLDELEVLEETWQFSNIGTSDFFRLAEFLDHHLYIVCEQQKDALLMKAFDAELAGDTKRSFQIVHNSLLLQYINQLASVASNEQKSKAIKMFMSKMSDKNHPARKAFDEDVNKTFSHIKNRCKVIQEEENQSQGVETIQLKSLDPNSELIVNIPETDSAEFSHFLEIPKEMQDALKTGSLDNVNEVFGTFPVEKAESILELFEKSGVIQIQALLDNEGEFNDLKQQYVEQDDLD